MRKIYHKDWDDYPNYVKENIKSFHCPKQSKTLGLIFRRINNIILTLLLEKIKLREAACNSQDIPEFPLYLGHGTQQMTNLSNRYYTSEVVENEKENILSELKKLKKKSEESEKSEELEELKNIDSFLKLLEGKKGSRSSSSKRKKGSRSSSSSILSYL